MKDKIVIFCAGGHSKVVINAIEMGGDYEVAFIADSDHKLVGTTLKGYKVCSEQAGIAAAKSGFRQAFVAVGHNEIRKNIAHLVQKGGFILATIVHPAAVVSPDVKLGGGTLVMPGSVVNADVVVGANVIINTGAIIEHDCRIGDNTHIAPRATLCGGVVVGNETLIGAGAVILPRLNVGSGVTVAAGAVVLSDVPDGAMVKGVPARIC
jgi:UDP-perosamine 4-acetyltransferase